MQAPIAPPRTAARGSIRRAFHNCLFGLGAIAAFASSTAQAQYADWTASPPKVMPNERVGSGVVMLGPDYAMSSGRQFSNSHAFVALKADGSIAAWGDGYYHYDQAFYNYDQGFYYNNQALPTGTGYKAIYSNDNAFAALKADGSIAAWGDPTAGGSGAPTGNGYTAIYSTQKAFAALKADGSITAWGDSTMGGGGTASPNGNPPTDVGYTAIYSNMFSFAALKGDGSIRQWGHSALYYGSGAVLPPTGTGYIAIYPSAQGYAALKADGSISAWGLYGDGRTPNVVPSGTGYTTICSSAAAFAALKSDGSISAWGSQYAGGIGAPTGTGYTAIYAADSGFAALKTDGSITAWGNPDYPSFNGTAPTDNGYTAIYSSNYGFTAIKADGTITYWGMPLGAEGVPGSTVAPSGNGFRAICSNQAAFAALQADGSIHTWGVLDGSTAPTGTGYKGIYSNRSAFAAIKADGSISAWGLGESSKGPTGSNFRSVQSVLNYAKLVFDPELTGTLGSITSSTAVVGGNVTSMANKTAAARGVVYALASSNADPQIGGTGVTQAVESPLGSTSTFELNLSGLSANSAYAYKAYVTDADGVSYYSPVATFSTNLPPVIISNGGNSTAAVSVAENTSAVSTVQGTDADAGQAITYSISGGADAAKFAIGSSSGALTFATAPDFEAPADADANNVYQVIVAATDNGNPPKSQTQTLNVTVTNVADSGEITVEQPAGSNVATGGTVAFGSVTVGQPLDLVFTVRSSGEVPLLLNGAGLSGTHVGDFALVGSLQSSLTIGSSTTFTVRFTPSGGGTRNAFLSLPNNDQSGGESAFLINLSGTGLTSATLATYANAASQVRGGWINSVNFTMGAVTTDWPSTESPDKAVDNSTGSKFLAFRNNNAGLILSPTNSNLVFNRLSLYTANDSSERDPASYVIYGSSTLLSGTSGTSLPLAGLTQLASGTITLPDNRTTGPTVVQFANTTAYASYIVAFPTVRSTASNSITQISEVQLSQGINPPCAVAMAGARGGQLSSGTFTFGSIGNTNPGTNWNSNESPDQAIDGSVDTKYLLFRNTGAGLIASPQAGPARVNRLNFWTANDSAERDPLTYQVYGFTTAVTARSGTLNVATSGTLLASGTLTLPVTRSIGSDTVTFANSTAYASYLVVFPTVKNSPSTTMTQIAELQFGYNGTPAFALSAATITVAEDSGSYSSNAFATDITPGIGDVGQTVSFAVSNNYSALFSVQPAIAADGTLTYTPAANANGSATVRVTATDSAGLSSALQSFTIVVTSVIDAPVLATTATSASIATTTATLGGEVTASEATVTERGVVYAITSANAAPQIGGTGVTRLVKSGTTGVFTANATSLAASTTYSFRAYATNSVGTSYSDVATFTTLALPSLSPSTQTLSGTYGTTITSTTAFTPTGMSGTVTYSVSPSLPAGLSLNSATGVISGNPAAVKTTSTIYTITGAGASSGSATATVALTVAKAPLTVVAVDQSCAYGAANLSFSATFSGLVNGDSSGVISGAADLVTVATSNSAPGTYTITASIGTLSATNYSFGNYTAGTLTIRKAAQSITLAPLASSVPLKNLSSVNLSATSSAGLPVTLSLGAGSAASLSGTVGSYSLTDIGTTGIVTVLANQAGNDNYAAATQVVATFDVTKANQVITFEALTNKTYGDSAITLAATSDSAQTVSYTITSGPATLNGNTLTLTGAGTVVVTANQAGNDSYNAAAAVERSFTVAQKTLTVTGAVAADKVADESDVATISGAQLVGVINGDEVTLANDGVGTFSQTTEGTNLTVTTTLTLAGANAGNYTLTQPTLTADITAPAVTHTHQELWRFANYGTYLSEGDAADEADPDYDGLNNLLEYALGLDPNASSVVSATVALKSANLEYTYTRSIAAKDAGATYQIEWSDTLEVGSWSTQDLTEQITSTQGALESVKVSVPASSGGKRFLRLQVVK